MSPVLTLLRRLRHSRGFGVHSPFAYRFITEVLRQPCAYYAYDTLGDDDTLRTVFRVALHCRPSRAAILSQRPGLAQTISAACPATELTRTAAVADMIICDATEAPASLPNAPDGRYIIFLGRDRTLWRQLLRRMPCGMTFDNRRTMAVAACLTHLPRQDFDIDF